MRVVLEAPGLPERPGVPPLPPLPRGGDQAPEEAEGGDDAEGPAGGRTPPGGSRAAQCAGGPGEGRPREGPHGRRPRRGRLRGGHPPAAGPFRAGAREDCCPRRHAAALDGRQGQRHAAAPAGARGQRPAICGLAGPWLRRVQTLRVVLEASGLPEWRGVSPLPPLPGGGDQDSEEGEGGDLAPGATAAGSGAGQRAAAAAAWGRGRAGTRGAGARPGVCLAGQHALPAASPAAPAAAFHRVVAARHGPLQALRLVLEAAGLRERRGVLPLPPLPQRRDQGAQEDEGRHAPPPGLPARAAGAAAGGDGPVGGAVGGPAAGGRGLPPGAAEPRGGVAGWRGVAEPRGRGRGALAVHDAGAPGPVGLAGIAAPVHGLSLALPWKVQALRVVLEDEWMPQRPGMRSLPPVPRGRAQGAQEGEGDGDAHRRPLAGASGP
mmetsp:Transcript_12771/g.39831  ORF Transcript_12771/g.39831 Transcript_12771/m.39831 type:complete len:435 (-) Transcript_12771:503-1807(-)